jgi:hypothetical protein
MNKICVKQLAGEKHVEIDWFPKTLNFEMCVMHMQLNCNTIAYNIRNPTSEGMTDVSKPAIFKDFDQKVAIGQ